MKKLKAVYQKMKEIFFRRLLKLEWPELYYINGPETLPPPLSREEEDEVMERVRRGEKNAREPLITHNLRLVVYICLLYTSLLRQENGKPYLRLQERAKMTAEKAGFTVFSVSVTHTREYAAVAVLAYEG